MVPAESYNYARYGKFKWILRGTCAQINASRRVWMCILLRAPSIYVYCILRRAGSSVPCSPPLAVLKFDVGGIKAKPRAGKSPVLSGEIWCAHCSGAAAALSWRLKERQKGASYSYIRALLHPGGCIYVVLDTITGPPVHARMRQTSELPRAPVRLRYAIYISASRMNLVQRVTLKVRDTSTISSVLNLRLWHKSISTEENRKRRTKR